MKYQYTTLAEGFRCVMGVKKYGRVVRNGKAHWRNYGRELKNGHGVSMLERLREEIFLAENLMLQNLRGRVFSHAAL